MSPTITTCPDCHASIPSNSKVCVNPNCETAQRAATADAARTTAKATAVVDRPNAFNISGRVD